MRTIRKAVLEVLGIVFVLFAIIMYCNYKVHNSKQKISLNKVKPACVIPESPVMPDYLKSLWKTESEAVRHKYDCNYETKFVTLHEEKTLSLQPNYSNGSCCLQEIHRGPTDASYSLTDCNPINATTTLNGEELYAVKCDKLINLEARIVKKPPVKKKINYWRFFPINKRPLSVLILGFDSTSRKNMYRSIPKTVELMKEMGFVDFQSYHSIYPSTLPNVLGFLTGLTQPTVRATCAPDWSAHFDTCPFIWKEFDQKNYVTMYAEDAPSTFNWGGQSGFSKQPTDYYLRHFFIALKHMRRSQIQAMNLDPWSEENMYLDCTSNEKIPDFLLRYTQRFIHKFAKIPFFAFTWLGNPFHEDMYFLQTCDEKLSRFFRSIRANPDLLGRTMILVLSDHGDRKSYFSGNSFESFIERALPPLFIRLPGILTRKYPKFAKSLETNSQLLTTPFDIHHTMRHLMSLGKIKGKNASYFKASMSDRSSLLVSLNASRTCEQTNILSTNCLCNVQYTKINGETSKLVLNKAFLRKALNYSISQLNSKIETSAYRNDCHKWTLKPSKAINFSRKLFESAYFAKILLVFNAQPNGAKFEAMLNVFLNLNDTAGNNSFELLGLTRVDAYHNQSWCVGHQTDADKILKELCICKEAHTKL